jgi:hypothetical protein
MALILGWRILLAIGIARTLEEIRQAVRAMLPRRKAPPPSAQ